MKRERKISAHQDLVNAKENRKATMSIKYMSAVWEDTLLEGNERLVMLAIADSGCGVDAPLPTLETISHKANLSVERTRQIIKSLVAKGYLNIEVQP